MIYKALFTLSLISKSPDTQGLILAIPSAYDLLRSFLDQTLAIQFTS